MELTAILTKCTPIESGTNQNGTWKKVTAVFKTVGDVPHEVAVTFLNDKAEAISKQQVGILFTVSVDADSHLYNGKYFTDLRGWRFKPAFAVPTNNQAAAQQQQAAPAPEPTTPPIPDGEPGAESEMFG